MHKRPSHHTLTHIPSWTVLNRLSWSQTHRFSAIVVPHVIVKGIQAAVLELKLSVELYHRVESSILVTHTLFHRFWIHRSS